MSTETQAPEQMQEDRVLQIADRQYKVSDLSEQSISHVNNVKLAEQKKNDAFINAQLLEVAMNTMQAQLVESLKDTAHTIIEKKEEATPE